jgi:hypothetical protein
MRRVGEEIDATTVAGRERCGTDEATVGPVSSISGISRICRIAAIHRGVAVHAGVERQIIG